MEASLSYRGPSVRWRTNEAVSYRVLCAGVRTGALDKPSLTSMNCCRHILLCLCAGALLCVASAVSAQAIYRQVDPSGGVVYTDRPDTSLPGGAELIAPAPAPRAEEPAPAQAAPVIRRYKQRYAAIDAREAERRLQQARLKRDQGAEPLPGEQLRGTSPSVLNGRYWQRQEQLRREVEAALRRVQETHQVLLAGR
jgi:hypothetical protein